MKQFSVTTSMGKRLIGKAMAVHPAIQAVLEQGTLVIIAGTTNSYVAQELLEATGQAEGFSPKDFRRGVVAAPGTAVPPAEFSGDVVLSKGVWQKGRTIFDTLDDLKPGDVVLKGANAFDSRGQAAVQIGSPVGGTILAAMTAVIGRRVQLIVPVGLEKRVFEDVNILAARCNAPRAEGPRLCLMPGSVFTELDALKLLTGADACLLAAGGVCGAEGAAWLGITGSEEQMRAAADLIESIAGEPPYEL